MSLSFLFLSLSLFSFFFFLKSTVDFFPCIGLEFFPKIGDGGIYLSFSFPQVSMVLDVAFYWLFPSLFLTSSPPTPEHSCPHPDLEGWVDTAPSMRDRNQLTLCAVPPSPALHSLMVCFSSPCQESSIPPHQPRWEAGLSRTCETPWSCFVATLPGRCSEQAGRNLKALRTCPHSHPQA